MNRHKMKQMIREVKFSLLFFKSLYLMGLVSCIYDLLSLKIFKNYFN